MSDRLVTALGALTALLLLGALMFQGPRVELTRPTTLENGGNGYAALARWLEGEGVGVRSLRRRMEALTGDELDVPLTGNVLITTMPHHNRVRRDEASILWRWIAEGNTLVVMAALNDLPRWALNADTPALLQDLERLTGLTFLLSSPDTVLEAVEDMGRTTAITLDAVAAHPLMTDVRTLHGESDFLVRTARVERAEDDESAVLQLARERREGQPALWQVRYGDGHIIVSALASALSNRAVGEGDNRVWVHNLLSFHLQPGGAVIFDDMHQGLSTLYDPDAFFGDPRLGITLLFVLGVWALYLLGSSSRLTPLRQTRPAPGQGDFVAGVGGFLARKLSIQDAGRLLLESWFDELRRRSLVPAGEGAPWADLSSMSALDPALLARLRVQHDALARGAAVDLRELHATIEELRRMIR